MPIYNSAHGTAQQTLQTPAIQECSELLIQLISLCMKWSFPVQAYSYIKKKSATLSVIQKESCYANFYSTHEVNVPSKGGWWWWPLRFYRNYLGVSCHENKPLAMEAHIRSSGYGGWKLSFTAMLKSSRASPIHVVSYLIIENKDQGGASATNEVGNSAFVKRHNALVTVHFLPAIPSAVVHVLLQACLHHHASSHGVQRVGYQPCRGCHSLGDHPPFPEW